MGLGAIPPSPGQELRHVYREFNGRADALARAARSGASCDVVRSFDASRPQALTGAWDGSRAPDGTSLGWWLAQGQPGAWRTLRERTNRLPLIETITTAEVAGAVGLLEAASECLEIATWMERRRRIFAEDGGGLEEFSTSLRRGGSRKTTLAQSNSLWGSGLRRQTEL